MAFSWRVHVFITFQESADDCGLLSCCVSCGVRPKVRPEGLNQVTDGAPNCVALEEVPAGTSIVIASDAIGEAGDDECFLVGLESVEERVSDDLAFLEVELENPESAIVLGICLGGD